VRVKLPDVSEQTDVGVKPQSGKVVCSVSVKVLAKTHAVRNSLWVEKPSQPQTDLTEGACPPPANSLGSITQSSRAKTTRTLSR
jgi:hypothetical protein